MAPKYTKASGFHGAVCWECYKANQRAYIKNWRRGTPDRPPEKNEYLEQKLQERQANHV